MPTRSPRWWWPSLCALVALRLAIPLAALVASGSQLPGLPHYRYSGLSGDATGFYACAREFIAAWARMPKPLLALCALALIATTFAAVRLWRTPRLRPWTLAGAVCAFGLVVCVDVAYQHPSGAAVFGWPLVWALPLLPFRALGVLGVDIAFGVGLVLSLLAVAVTVVATAYAGLYATGRRAAGLVAATIFALWPFLPHLVVGTSAWQNGTWAIDVGLHMYTEPLSTALIASALALLLAPRPTPVRLALTGALLSLATLVKLSNGIAAAIALVLLAWRLGPRPTLPYLAGAASLAPLVAVYWHLGYAKLFDKPQSWPRDPFDPHHVVESWTHSLVFTPRMLLVLAPFVLLGVWTLRRPYEVVVVAAFLFLNPIFYSFYANTAQHPRFLYASLPSLFVCAGSLLYRLWERGRALLPTPATQ